MPMLSTDYTPDIPLPDIEANPVILATEMDGKAMALRDG